MQGTKQHWQSVLAARFWGISPARSAVIIVRSNYTRSLYRKSRNVVIVVEPQHGSSVRVRTLVQERMNVKVGL
jgi:hypothetical protein